MRGALPCCSPVPQADDKSAIESEAALLAFDRQNHMGASEALASRLRETIAEEAEALLADKHCVTGVNNIGDNRDRMKVRAACLAGPAG